MDGLCQPGNESHRTTKDEILAQNWLEENCVCLIDPTTKTGRLEEEEKESWCSGYGYGIRGRRRSARLDGS